MGFAAKHNRGSIDWGVDTNGFQFVNRAEAYKENADTVHTVKGLYINTKGNFGDHPVAICDGYFLDLPENLLDDVKDILHSEEDISTIKAGKVGFKVEEYVSEKFKKTCYGIRWVDIV